VHVLSSAPLADSAWSFGGSILTFAFPMILFIAVAATLWVLYTKPEVVPGHRAGAAERPVSYTPEPGQPTTEVVGARDTAAAQGIQAPASQQGQSPAEQSEAGIQEGGAARTEDGE
jgi:hypothetical protein